mmetsp:Transcript_10617/g.19402  ORF Transcript_10617/g.19402 Transcript_10617/m.19402 type:complete len:139 (-) Transcript_10617:608-1024(-)
MDCATPRASNSMALASKPCATYWSSSFSKKLAELGDIITLNAFSLSRTKEIGVAEELSGENVGDVREERGWEGAEEVEVARGAGEEDEGRFIKERSQNSSRSGRALRNTTDPKWKTNATDRVGSKELDPEASEEGVGG